MARAFLSRREALALGIGGLVLLRAAPASAARPSLTEAIHAFTGGIEPNAGRVRLEVAPLVENGNAVGVTLLVESPMTEAEHVRRIALFNEKNPQPDVAIFHLGSRAGRASVSTRIRLATTQTLAAVAELSDGSFWMAQASVIVTLAACVEDLS